MNYRHATKGIILALALICLLALVGCKTATLHVNSVPQTRVELYSARHSAQIYTAILSTALAGIMLHPVDINTRFRGEDIQITVVASTNINCQTAVKYLRNKEWSLAIDNFHKAIVADPNDHCAYFGDGVCHELIADILADGRILSWLRDDTVCLSDPVSGKIIESVRENQAVRQHPEWLYAIAKAQSASSVSLNFLLGRSTRSAVIRHKSIPTDVTFWNADSWLELFETGHRLGRLASTGWPIPFRCYNPGDNIHNSPWQIVALLYF